MLGNNGLRLRLPVDTDWQPGGKIYDLCLFYFGMHQQYGSGILLKQPALSRWVIIASGFQPWTMALSGAPTLELPETERSIKDHLTTDQITTLRLLISRITNAFLIIGKTSAKSKS